MWIAMVSQLPLSRVEQEVLRRFQEDPSGRQFLPLSDVLRTHKLVDESLELLTQGVQNHPGFAIARVVLARELFQRGLVLEAWEALENSQLPLSDNILAQKLRFKIAVLLGDESTARSAMQLLRIQQGVDPEARRLFDQLEIDGIQSVRDSFRADLQKKGVDLHLPGTALGQQSEKPQAQKSQQSPEGVIRAKGQRFILEYELDSATRKLIENFHVVPLSEVFVPDSAANSAGGGGQQVELDSTTLAEIYAKQGVYSKALSIYRRLLRMSPHNDLIRLKVSEMARLEREQRSDDLAADPVVFERMEVNDLIDRQMRFMQGLLNKLEQNQK
jgi:tetratricopeptide (TPR) repeat protein